MFQEKEWGTKVRHGAAPDSNRAMAAAAAVFDIAELFEEILTFLSIEELTRAQQVSRSWRNCIAASPELTRTLLFEMQPRMIVPRVLREKLTDKCISTVVLDRINGTARRLLPVLRFAPPVKVRIDKGYWPSRAEDEVFYLSIDVRDLLLRPSGAWEQIRLTQPTIKAITVELGTVAATNQPGGDLWESLHLKQIHLENPSGVRIADVTEHMRAIVKDYEVRTRERVNLTSFWDASFRLEEHVYEESDELREAFNEQSTTSSTSRASTGYEH